MSKLIVAIDGPAGSGKSSVSKAAAKRLGFGYLDTGAAYRALTWATQNLEGFELETLPIRDLPTDFDYAISTNPDNYWVKVGSSDLTEAIRSTEVAEGVAEVARIPEVRSYMKQLTKAIVDECPYPGIIVEGRDITTVVLPDATKRILLTASEEVRLSRRSSELGNKTAQQVAKQVSERDKSDSKVVDFLNPAPGVTLLDSTDLNFDQTVDAVVNLVNAAN
ncbi:MAG: (d)CMP kinase [Micrococcales bacterium]